MAVLKDEIGNIYGRLTVINRSENNKDNRAMWCCVCRCKNLTVVRGADLRNGNTQSCGCLNKERVKETWIGRKHSKKSMKKMSESHWNHNITDEERQLGRFYPKYTEWRHQVYERDSYTCQVCGQVGGNLVAHHLEGYNSNKELRTTLSNGITLCEACHNNFHHQYGRGNNTRKQFEEFIGGK